MGYATGFLVRTDLSDTGTMPRSGNWTGCPDIIPAGPTAISREDLIRSYGSVTNTTLTEGLSNFLYVRARNMNPRPLTQKAYLFQVPGSLILHPEVWYDVTNLVGYDVYNAKGDGTIDDPTIIQKHEQKLSADAYAIGATDAYTWKPESTEHYCLVAVVADSWQDVLANYPAGGSVDGLAQWIYGHASMGWHNVSIQPITSTIYERSIPFVPHLKADEWMTFTIVAQNVPAGAAVGFWANTSTSSGETIGQDWTTVSKPRGWGERQPRLRGRHEPAGARPLQDDHHLPDRLSGPAGPVELQDGHEGDEGDDTAIARRRRGACRRPGVELQPLALAERALLRCLRHGVGPGDRRLSRHARRFGTGRRR